MGSAVLAWRGIQVSPVTREKSRQYPGIKLEFPSRPARGPITILIALFQLRPFSELEVTSAAFRGFVLLPSSGKI
jgi:hypothetical protein